MSDLAAPVVIGPRKRNRRIVTCLECHRRRVKCDKGRPCQACVARGLTVGCSYETAPSKERGGKAREQHTTEDQGYRNKSSPLHPTLSHLDATRLDSVGERPPMDASGTTSSRSTSSQLTSSATSPSLASTTTDKRSKTYGLYSRQDAVKLRRACFQWPCVARVPNITRFFFAEMNTFSHLIDEEEMNQYLARRILPLLECQDDDSFYHRTRPGDATKLALTMAIIVNASMRCSAGSLSLWFSPREPTQRILPEHFTCEARDRRVDKLKGSLKTLLVQSIELDEPSPTQVRALIALVETLKSEGTMAGPHVREWLVRLTQSARSIHLLNDLPDEPDVNKREAWSRLFVSFVMTNWHGASVFGEDLRVTELKTTFPSVMQDRAQEVLMTRFNLGRILGELGKIHRHGKLDWRKVDDIEDELQDAYRQIPADYRPYCAADRQEPYNASLLRDHRSEPTALRLQKHLLATFFYFLRDKLHRTRFLQHPDIPEERVEHSRRICVENARDAIFQNQEYRAECASESWVRGFYFVYFVLEQSVVLVLAAFTTLGDAEARLERLGSGSIREAWEGGPLQAALIEARSHLAWSQRGADLLSSLPMDASTNVQASEFLQRLMEKANSLIEWYETHAKAATSAPCTAIFSAALATQHVLTDGEGRPLQIPLIDNTLPNEAKKDTPSSSTPSRTPQSQRLEPENTFLFPPSPLVQEGTGAAAMAALGMVPGSYDGPYLGGLDESFFQLPRKVADDPLSMFESAPPLEEQIDAWLALLQH